MPTTREEQWSVVSDLWPEKAKLGFAVLNPTYEFKGSRDSEVVPAEGWCGLEEGYGIRSMPTTRKNLTYGCWIWQSSRSGFIGAGVSLGKGGG